MKTIIDTNSYEGLIKKLKKTVELNKYYTDNDFDNKITNITIELDLTYDILENESTQEYLLRILDKYNRGLKNLDEIDKKSFLKCKSHFNYLHDFLKFHSAIINGQIEITQDIILTFTDFLTKLYFDRDDGYYIEQLDLTNSFSTFDINANTLLQNTRHEVNLICFFESQREPDYKLRTDSKIFNMLLKIGWIFNFIGHDVIILGSDIHIDKLNRLYWIHIPYKFNDIYNRIIENPVQLHNLMNIYIQVNFDCM